MGQRERFVTPYRSSAERLFRMETDNVSSKVSSAGASSFFAVCMITFPSTTKLSPSNAPKKKEAKVEDISERSKHGVEKKAPSKNIQAYLPRDRQMRTVVGSRSQDMEQRRSE